MGPESSGESQSDWEPPELFTYGADPESEDETPVAEASEPEADDATEE